MKASTKLFLGSPGMDETMSFQNRLKLVSIRPAISVTVTMKRVSTARSGKKCPYQLVCCSTSGMAEL